jgi:uncharacterized protein YjiK
MFNVLSHSLPILSHQESTKVRRCSRRTFFWVLTAIGLPAFLLIGIYQFRLEALAWHLWRTNFSQAPAGHSLDLDGYRVALDGIPIAGLSEDVSGLTYNQETNTLFSVLNKQPDLVEISLDGHLLRKVRIDGVKDMEGITHIDGNRFVIADERDSRLILIHLEDGVDRMDISNAPQIDLGIDASGNKNFEGVSWDERNNRLLVVKEKDPLRILSVEGFVKTKPNGTSNLRISQLTHSQSTSGKLRDFSSVTFHDQTEHPVLLSDESRMAVEYSAQGKPLSALALWKGFHGLKNNVPQAEGIAIGPDNRVYIVSEPNLFYVFAPYAN